MSKCNVYAHVYPTAQVAFFEAGRFWGECRNELLSARRYGSYIKVSLKDGTEHYFIGEVCFGEWCRGRTYYIGKTLCHSGDILKVGDSDEI